MQGPRKAQGWAERGKKAGVTNSLTRLPVLAARVDCNTTSRSTSRKRVGARVGAGVGARSRREEEYGREKEER
eukprot:6340338-Pyramimonas_sp.AAC.1